MRFQLPFSISSKALFDIPPLRTKALFGIAASNENKAAGVSSRGALRRDERRTHRGMKSPAALYPLTSEVYT